MSISMLCMMTICVPSKQFDLVNYMEFTQCSLSCLSNPKNALAYYVFKNYNILADDLSIKRSFASNLQNYLTKSLVIEGLDSLTRSGLSSEQIRAIQNFKINFINSQRGGGRNSN